MDLNDLIGWSYRQCARPWAVVPRLLDDRLAALASGPSPGLDEYDVYDVQGVIATAEHVLEAAREGDFQEAGCCARGGARREASVVRTAEWREFCGAYLPSFDPTWAPLWHACDLAARIDALLFSLEDVARPLALACRDDLAALPILADWCDDAGRPAAATELRHLHGLVRCLRDSLG